jgi:hypothetical protein
MKNLLLFILLIQAGIPVYSQAPASELYDSTLRVGLMGFEYRNSAERYKGDQYFNSWTKGDVNLENGDVISNIFLRYDQFMDEVLWLRETDFKTGVLPRGDIRGFVLYNQQKEILAEFVRRGVKLPYKSDSSETFLQVLVKGRLELFAYRKVKQSANDYRLDEDTRYLLFTNGKSYFVDAGKRQLGKVPEIDETKMKAIFKSNHFKPDGTENSLIRFIDLYNKGN